MAKIHILTGGGNNLYTAVIHTATPAGNNTAGIAWSTALQNSGMATTVMPIGNGAGQISQSESNQIAAGTLIEATTVWQNDPAWNTAERNADLDLRATQAVTEKLAALQVALALFGATRG